MENDLFKARYGRYEDNTKNRRLHRVGQEYGDKKTEDEDKADKNTAEEQLAAINNKEIELHTGYKQGNPMTFEEANEEKGNPMIKQSNSDEYRDNCQTCVVVYELRLRGFDIGALGKVNKEQFEMAKDITYAWIDPLTGLRPEFTSLTCAPNNRLEKVRKSKKAERQLYQNINAATKEPGRYNFEYGWKDKKSSGGHVLTLERYTDGKIAVYDPQIGRNIPIEKLLAEVHPQYMCKLIRVDNLLIKPDIINKYTKKYE